MELTATVWNERDEKLNVNEIASLGRVAEVQKTIDEIFHGFYQKNMNHLELVEVKEYYYKTQMEKSKRFMHRLQGILRDGLPLKSCRPCMRFH